MGRAKTPALSKRNIVLLFLVASVVLVMVGSSVFLGNAENATPSTLSSNWNTNRGQTQPQRHRSSFPGGNRRRQHGRHQAPAPADDEDHKDALDAPKSQGTTFMSLKGVDGTRDKCTLVASVTTAPDGITQYVDNSLSTLARSLQVSVQFLLDLNPALASVDASQNVPLGFRLTICQPKKMGNTEPSTKKVSTTTAVPAKTFPPGFDPRKVAVERADDGGDPENARAENDEMKNNPLAADEKKHDEDPNEQDLYVGRAKADQMVKENKEEERKVQKADEEFQKRGKEANLGPSGGMQDTASTLPPKRFRPNIDLDPQVYNPTTFRRSWMVSKTEDHLCGKEVDKTGLPDYLQGVGVGHKGHRTRYKSAPEPPALTGPRADYVVTDDHIRQALGENDLGFLDNLEMLYVRKVFVSLILGQKFPTADDVIPVWVEPLFMDADEMKEGLSGVDVPVRQYVFLWNSKSEEMKAALAPLRKIKFGLLIVENGQNVGFSNSLNTGIMKGQELVKNPSPTWTFCVNADVGFPTGSLHRIAYYGNKHGDGEYGLIYGFEQEHYAFGITQSAVRRVGLLDEVIWPAYMEDVDYRWRVRMCGLGQITTGGYLRHKRSVNLRFKRGPEIDLFKQQHGRNGGGFAYGHNKWGGYHQGDIVADAPPSGWRTPFNIADMPLSLWAVDPVNRECVKSGRGVFRPGTPHCWYNGTVLLEWLPPGTQLPRKILDPEPNRGYGPGHWSHPRIAPNKRNYMFPQPLPTSFAELTMGKTPTTAAPAKEMQQEEAANKQQDAALPPPQKDEQNVDSLAVTRVPVPPYPTKPPRYFTPNIYLDPQVYNPTTFRRSWMVSKTEDHLCGKDVNTDGLPDYLKGVGVSDSRQNIYATAPAPPPEAHEGPRFDYQITDDDYRALAGSDDIGFLKDERYSYVHKAAQAVILGRRFPTAPDVIPVWVEPLFMDEVEMKEGLTGVDAPVRLFVFLWNSKAEAMGSALQPLRKFKFGVHIIDNNKNVGFSNSLNTGIMKGQELVQNPSPTWTFCVNADVSFPVGSLSRIAYYANKHGDGEYGLIYGFEQEHYAFGITQSAVRRVGLLDEVIWPAYMEDVDYRWRVRLCGLGQITTGAPLNHKRSVNLRFKRGPEIDLFKQQHGRNAGGYAYGHSKWGGYGQGDITRDAPPSEWRTPWNIPGFPLSLWAVDPVQRECVNSGRGIMRPGTPHCWYNGTVLLEYLPIGTKLPRKILQPEPDAGYHNGEGQNEGDWSRAPVLANLGEPRRRFSDPLPTSIQEGLEARKSSQNEVSAGQKDPVTTKAVTTKADTDTDGIPDFSDKKSRLAKLKKKMAELEAELNQT